MAIETAGAVGSYMANRVMNTVTGNSNDEADNGIERSWVERAGGDGSVAAVGTLGGFSAGRAINELFGPMRKKPLEEYTSRLIAEDFSRRTIGNIASNVSGELVNKYVRETSESFAKKVAEKTVETVGCDIM